MQKRKVAKKSEKVCMQAWFQGPSKNHWETMSGHPCLSKRCSQRVVQVRLEMRFNLGSRKTQVHS
jgi:hypothetical protein